ncbi:hypothetical protein SUDANB5_00712 [Streptomyces sp. SudanB5_2050]|uniref:hypothetical protein n=1 Tax=Streptomyces sp. SudanB5_2050 TaxID=3035274 RepID=UPI0036D93062
MAGRAGVDLGGRTDPRAFAGVLRAADALVTGSGGAAGLAAAVGTPVVPPASRDLTRAVRSLPRRR